MPIFDVTAHKFNVLVYVNNIEAHKKDNCFHDDDNDNDNNTKINMQTSNISSDKVGSELFSGQIVLLSSHL
jgi:hypothetical protein